MPSSLEVYAHWTLAGQPVPMSLGHYRGNVPTVPEDPAHPGRPLLHWPQAVPVWCELARQADIDQIPWGGQNFGALPGNGDHGYGGMTGFQVTGIRIRQRENPGTDFVYTILAPDGTQIGPLNPMMSGYYPPLGMPAVPVNLRNPDGSGIWTIRITRAGGSNQGAPALLLAPPPNGTVPYVSPYGHKEEGSLTLIFEGDELGEQPDCPVIANLSAHVGDCQPDGTVEVTLSADVNPVGQTTVVAFWQDDRTPPVSGASSVIPTDPPTVTSRFIYPGDGSHHAATLVTRVVSPQLRTCPPQQVAYDLPDCQPEPPCPRPSFDRIDVSPDCTQQNQRTVTVVVTVSPTPTTPQGIVEAQLLIDGAVVAQGDNRNNPGAVVSLQAANDLPPGMHTAQVNIIEPPGCQGADAHFTVAECPGAGPCPGVTVNPVDEASLVCNANGTVTVNVSADVTPVNLPVVVHWTFDGVPSQRTTTLVNPGMTRVSEAHDYPGDGGSHTATLTIDQPPECRQPPPVSFRVPRCAGGPPNGGGESLGCGGLRVGAAVAAAMAILAALLAVCVPAAAVELAIVAAVFGLLAAALGAIYAIFCPNKPCEWALLLAGQTFLGAGVGASIMSGCCPWMLGAGLGAVVVGLGLLLLWQQRCDQSLCTLAKEVTFVIGGIVLPIVGVLAGIPLIQACVNGVASAVVGALFGPVAAFAARCRDGGT